MPRYFTVAEANALLPFLRPPVSRLIRAWQGLSALQQPATAILNSAPHNDLGGPILAAAAVEIIRAQNAIVAIHALGAELKDPATGLLDFLALRDGVEIYLCWRYGEQDIQFWHPLETGVAGRQPLDDKIP